MNIIIAGGRTFNDYNVLVNYWNAMIQAGVLYGTVSIVSGTANGADKLGERLARDVGMAIMSKPANWNLHGKSAGYKRNVEMSLIGDILIACWDGKSRGTKHMIDIMHSAGKPVYIINY